MSLIVEEPTPSGFSLQERLKTKAASAHPSPSRAMSFPHDSSSESESSSDNEALPRERVVAETREVDDTSSSGWLERERNDPLLCESQDRFSLFPIQ